MGFSEWLARRRMRKLFRAEAREELSSRMVESAIRSFLKHTTQEERLEMIDGAIHSLTASVFEELRKEENIERAEQVIARTVKKIGNATLNALNDERTDERLIKAFEGLMTRLEHFSLNVLEISRKKAAPQNVYRTLFTLEKEFMSVIETFFSGLMGQKDGADEAKRHSRERWPRR